MPNRYSPHGQDDHDDAGDIDPLRIAAAQILLATAAESVFGPDEGSGVARSLPMRAPALLAPLAATAHLAHMSRPSPESATVSRVLDTAVLAAGAAAAVASLVTGVGRGRPALSTVALASAGLLGLLIDRHERHDARERHRLERRASVVERLVPRRRPRLDHVVVHV